MTVIAKPVYCFGSFRYDAEQRVLFRDGAIVPLVPKAVETLEVLLEQRGRVVDKSELMRRVWPDAVVEEIGLQRNISLLRKALGDAGAEHCIETISKRGYRFVAEVRVPASDAGQVAAATPALPGATGHARPYSTLRRIGASVAALLLLAAAVYWQFYRPSQYLPGGQGFAHVAVVPFTCLSPEIGCGTFARAFTEVLVADLSKLDAVHVTSPSTVERYQRARISMSWMARMLGLEVLVEGTVQKVGDRLRFTARLGDVHSGMLIWAESYEYPAADFDQAETAAAHAIATQVGAHLKQRQRPPDR